MKTEIEHVERKEIENLERRKKELWYIFDLEEIKKYLAHYRTKKTTVSIDAKKLENALVALDDAMRRRVIHNMSSDDSDWLPSWVFETISWARGGMGFYGNVAYCLGVDLLRCGRKDLLRILAKTGDSKAKQIKTRTRMPRELVGKSLEWIQVNKNEYRVIVKNIKETISIYEKVYIENFT